VPKRTNAFQKVVTIIHEHLVRADPNTTIEQSAMLPHRSTKPVEVDVVIRTRVANQELIISVEATARKRPATVEWIREMIGKHKGLHTHQLILVSESGYTPEARTLAAENGVVLYKPEDLEGADPEARIVGRLDRIWSKHVTLTLTRASAFVVTADDRYLLVRDVPFDVALEVQDRSESASVHELFQGVKGAMPKIAEELGVADIGETGASGKISIRADGPWKIRGKAVPDLYLRQLETDEEHRLLALEFDAHAEIKVIPVDLTHKRMGDTAYSQGTSTVDGKSTVFVATSGPDGEQTTTLVEGRAPEYGRVPPVEPPSEDGEAVS
jgi:hypothetical protein